MSVPSPFLTNSFSSLLLIKSSTTDLKCFWPFNSKKLPSVKAKNKMPEHRLRQRMPWKLC